MKKLITILTLAFLLSSCTSINTENLLNLNIKSAEVQVYFNDLGQPEIKKYEARPADTLLSAIKVCRSIRKVIRL